MRTGSFPQLPVFVAMSAMILLGPAAVVQADPASDRAAARERFELAERQFKQGLFAEALTDYEAGYQLAPLPGFLIDIAHCHRMLGDLRKARAYYRKFILVAPQSPRRSEVQEIVKDLDRAIADGLERPISAADAGGPAAKAAPHTPSARWWLWTAVASAVVGSTVASLAVAEHP